MQVDLSIQGSDSLSELWRNMDIFFLLDISAIFLVCNFPVHLTYKVDRFELLYLCFCKHFSVSCKLRQVCLCLYSLYV